MMNHKLDEQTPRFDVQLLFDEIGIALDADQYRAVISLIDMYHVYMRQHQVSELRLYLIKASTSALYSIANSGLPKVNSPPMEPGPG